MTPVFGGLTVVCVKHGEKRSILSESRSRVCKRASKRVILSQAHLICPLRTRNTLKTMNGMLTSNN